MGTGGSNGKQPDPATSTTATRDRYLTWSLWPENGSVTLPLLAGMAARPLHLADARAVYEVMAALQEHELGAAEIEEADIVGDWQRPSFDVAASTMGVFDGDRLVGYAEYAGGDRADAAVHPEYHGRGIGTALAGWLVDRARSTGAAAVGMPVPLGHSGDRLLAALGWRVRWTSWALTLPEGATIPVREHPEGYGIREARPEEYRHAQTVIEDAFLEWSRRDRQSYEDWAARAVLRPGFEPWMLRVAVDPSGVVVAAALVFLAHLDVVEGFVDQLATRADQRGRGLAQALLVDAFTAARAHGAVRSGLATDSRTGALGLYEKVGMVVTQTWVNRAVTV